VLKALKRTGYDSVEVPIFEGTIDSYARLGEQLARMDLDVTTVSVLGRVQLNATPWYMHGFTCTVAVIAAALAGLITLQSRHKE